MISAPGKAFEVPVPSSAIPQQQTQPVNYDSCLALARAQRYDDAVGSFEALLRREPGNDKAWISYAQVLALCEYIVSVAGSPLRLSASQMSKRRYMQQGAQSLAYEACGNVLDRAVSANPQSAKIWQARGLLELQQGNACEARELLQKAVALDRSLAGVLKWKIVGEGSDQPGDAEALSLLTPSGGVVTVGNVIRGRFCWEQAQALLLAQDQFGKEGYKLMVVAIGSPEGGRQFCTALPFPPELLLLDPEPKLYRHLSCMEGVKALFSPQAWEAMKSRKWADFKVVLQKYKMIPPKNAESTSVMGGVWVMNDGKVLYSHRDVGPGVHAPMSEVLAACRSGSGASAAATASPPPAASS
ncbi:hypothetical protein VOLCADRAFT_104125 [Volvox carteri f. nagariensis]|uniref:Uncharacterized protein n=1 Tax=Volvox carteri f. nagariensis TaxID=3068 RepID=D8TRD6_VOLCA|nr:uncharacterized protein VOLCADRAFT_104125 [Volvox carteri f. nagariensis]EFJ49875.1 hypothetical protein VOLCADRAFT_104125 [Volvox carteri f. nagariensis]|eukprot:XP_002948940.1 hypothetical protein VOLCADRAFT_104125 [Volvox carteri f. nagariensis]